MNDLVNLLVDLRSQQFDTVALAPVAGELERSGYALESGARHDPRFFAWIDDEFGGAWSSEAAAGSTHVASSEGRYAGFATYDPRGLRYAWLRGIGARPDVGIFGPFGVSRRLRGSNLGPNLLRAALSSLRAAGYANALVPAVSDPRLIAYYARTCGARAVERFSKTALAPRPYRTVVLASGNGSNFQAVIDGVAAGRLPLEITLLVCNNPNAFASERARRAGIRTVMLPWQRDACARTDYDAQLLEAVRAQSPDLVLLLGWMHLLDSRFIEAFAHIVNVHPAFLPLDESLDDVTFPDGTVTPAFRGAHAVHDALRWGSLWIGASVHRVTPLADRGPILARAPLRVLPGEEESDLFERLHSLEHRVLNSAILRWVYER